MNLTAAAMAVTEVVVVLALAGCGGGSANENSNDGLSAAADARRLATAASATSNITVRARASLAANVGPLMTLRLNGAAVRTAEVRSTDYQDYIFQVAAIPAGAKVDVVFNNDAMVNGQDRNLFVASITANGTTIESTASGVTYDRGAGAQAFDGLDVLPGQRSMLWNGALRFTVGGGDDLAGLSPACTKFYAGKPNFALTSSRTVDAIPAMAKPARGAVYAEPTYGTCASRVTDHAADGMVDYAKNVYSRIQAFNADNTRLLAVARNGVFGVYDANNRSLVKKITSGFGSEPEVQWHPTNPDLLYSMPYWGSEMVLKETSVSTGAVRVVGAFEARLKALFPGSEPGQVQTRSEGSPSKDGRYWCFLARDKNKANQWGVKLGIGVFTWDRDTDTIVGHLPLNGELPNYVSMSPSGEYCVVGSEKEGLGVTAFSRDFKQRTKLLSEAQHSDLAIDANGKDVYVGIDNRAGATDGHVLLIDLKTGTKTTLFNSYTEGNTAFLFSGKAHNKPGWILVSTYATDGQSQKWLHRKIMAVQLKANPVIYNLAFHRSYYPDDDGYDAAPMASVNRDFTRVVYNSNWGSRSYKDVDEYTIEIPSGALKANTSATPTTLSTPTTPKP